MQETDSILKIIAEYDLFGEIFWDDNLKFYVICNDFFAVACADSIEISSNKDIQLLEKCLMKSADFGTLIYCMLKIRKMPCREFIESLRHKDKALFNEQSICML